VFELANSSLVIDVREPGSEPATSAVDLSTLVEEVTESPKGNHETSEINTPAPPPEPDLNDVRDRLVEQLTRAADQGLLRLSDTPPPPSEPDPAPAELEETVEHELNEINEAPPSHNPTVEIHTAFEWRDQPTRSARSPCGFPEPITAGAEQTRYNEFISARAELYGEFDAIDEQKLDKTIKLALGLGYGAEAAALLSRHSGLLQFAEALQDMARLVDGREIGTGLMIYAECSGSAGLWARLSSTDGELVARYASRDLETLESFPPDYRMLMAELMAGHFLELSQTASAQRALDLALRTGISPSRELQLIEAMVALKRRDLTMARQQLIELSVMSDLVSLKARTHLVELDVAEGTSVDPAAELDLAAIAFQLRGTPLGREAIRLLASIRALDGELSHSLQLLTESIAREPDMAPIWRRVAADLVEGTPADRPDYARAVLHYADLLPDGVSGDGARLAAAEGLLSLGLPSDAVELAKPAVDRGSEAAAELTLRAINNLQRNGISPAPELAQGPAPVVPSVTLATAAQMIENGRELRLTATRLLNTEPQP